MEPNAFHPDAETASQSEDRLERYPFAQRVARAIATWQSAHSLTLAIYGDYGAGKSSLKRFIIAALAEHLQEPVETTRAHLLEIAPWSWVRPDDWISAFFRELGLAIGASIPDPERRERAASTVASLGERVGGAQSVLETASALATVLGFAIPTGPVARLLEQVRRGFKSRAESERGLAGAAGATPLRDTKTEIASILAERDRPLIVFVDEIDRLTDSEIRTLFRVVRANADFPNLVFMLFFQRDVVETALEGEATSGSEYLEKMVQVGLDLPEPPPGRIATLFADIVTEAASSVPFTSDDQREAFRTDLLDWYPRAVEDYVQTPRHVARLANTYRFYLGGFAGPPGGTLSVNRLDLLLLEVLRHGEPSLYARLPYFKEELVMGHLGESGRGRLVQERQHHLQNLTQNLVPPATEILAELFPLARSVIDNDASALNALSEQGAEWARLHRVAHPEIFDRYFEFSSAAGESLQERVEALVEAHGDSYRVALSLEEFARRGELGEGLQRLAAYADRIAAGRPAQFIATFFLLGDHRTHLAAGEPPTPFADDRLIRQILAAVSERGQKSADSVLARALKITDALALPVRVATRATSKPHAYSVEPALSNQLGHAIHRIILKHAQDGTLIESAQLAYLLTTWDRIVADPPPDGLNTAQRWAHEFSDKPWGLLRILAAFPDPDVDPADQPSPSFAWDRLARFLDLDRAANVLEWRPHEIPTSRSALAEAFLKQYAAEKERAQSEEPPDPPPEVA